jgi:hypothetical protein
MLWHLVENVITCTVVSLLFWSLLNRGPGQALFLYPA